MENSQRAPRVYLRAASAILAMTFLGNCASVAPLVSADTPAQMASDLAAAFSDADTNPSFAVIPLGDRPPSGVVSYSGGFITNTTSDTQFVVGTTNVDANFGTGLMTGSADNITMFQATAGPGPGGSTVITSLSDVRQFTGSLPMSSGVTDNGATGEYDMEFEGNITGDLPGFGAADYRMRVGSSGDFFTSDTGEYMIGTSAVDVAIPAGAVILDNAGYDGFMILRKD